MVGNILDYKERYKQNTGVKVVKYKQPELYITIYYLRILIYNILDAGSKYTIRGF